MSDDELIDELGLRDCDPAKTAIFIRDLPPEKRDAYEHLIEVARDLQRWEQGAGPLPAGVIVCKGRGERR